MTDPRILMARLTAARIAMRHASIRKRRPANDNFVGWAA